MLRVELEKLRCGLDCEREHNTTLEMEQATTHEKLHNTIEENQALLEELERVRGHHEEEVKS